MQIMSQSLPKITAKNVRSTTSIPNLYYLISPESDSSSPQLPLIQEHWMPENLNSNPDHIAEPHCLLQYDGFNIHLVNSPKQRIKTSTLIKRMYASRGYDIESASVFSYNPNQFTFLASVGEIAAGTLTLGIDSDEGLLADELYHQEINNFRKEGRKVCELSKLVIDPQYSSKCRSKEMIALLFQIAYIYAHSICKATDFFCEVNPRHAEPQKRMFGFRKIGEVRTCPRVNAPAVLLHLDLGFVKKQIDSLAGSHNKNTKDQSLYPYCISHWPDQRIENPGQHPPNQHLISAFN